MRPVSLFCLIVLVLVALLLSGDYEFVLAHHKVTRSNGGNFRYKKRATLTVVASISATDSTGSSASELPSAVSSDNSNSDSTTHGIKRQLDNSSILLSSSSNLSSNSATPTNTNTTTTTTTISPTLSTTTSTTSQTTNLTLTPFFSLSSNISSSVPTPQSSDTTSTTTTTTTAQSTTTSSSTLSSSSTLVPPLQPTPVQSAPNITPTSNLGGNSTPLPNSQYKAPQNYPVDSSSKTDPQSNDQINNNNLTPNMTGSGGPNSSGDSGGLGSSDSSSSKDSGSSGDSGNSGNSGSSGDSGSSGGSGSSGESGGPGGSGGTETAQTASPTENTDHQDFASEKPTPNKLLGPVIGGTIATLAGVGMVVLVTVRKRRKCTSLEISSGNWSDHDSLDAPIEPMTQFRPSSFLIAVRSVVNKLPLPRDSANITGESKFVERMDFDEDGQLGWSQQDDQIVVDTIDEANLIHN